MYISAEDLVDFYDHAVSFSDGQVTATCCTLCQRAINVTCGLGQSCAAACFAESASLCPSHDCTNCHTIDDTTLASSETRDTEEPTSTTHRMSSSTTTDTTITTNQKSTTLAANSDTTSAYSFSQTKTGTTTFRDSTTPPDSITKTVLTTSTDPKTSPQRGIPTESTSRFTTGTRVTVTSPTTPEEPETEEIEVNVTVTGMSNFTLLINSVEVGGGSEKYHTYNFPSKIMVGWFPNLVVKAHDWGVKKGIIVATSNDLFTNSTWRCINDTGAKLPPISEWPKAREAEHSAQMKEFDDGPGKNSKGKWIWAQQVFSSVACAPDEGEFKIINSGASERTRINYLVKEWKKVTTYNIQHTGCLKKKGAGWMYQQFQGFIQGVSIKTRFNDLKL